MAKAKKSDGASEPAVMKSPATKPAAGKETAKKRAPASAKAAVAKPASGSSKKSAKSEKPATGQPRQAPLIDTGLAAQAAASMIANRVVAGTGGVSGQSSAQPAKQESSSFKNLKEGISKPSIGGLGAILGGGSGQTKLHQGFGGPKPSVPGGAKNQTFGADVNRAGVPRRTGG